ncbi:hypothetical protein, partial [Aphanothece microscopica]|uniref:hypothetical protein n=1 Tax=Aphanothece microscopica TaxID=1049561 RepID=UPI003984CEE1
TAELDSTGGVTLTAKLGPVDTLAISGDGLVTVGGAADLAVGVTTIALSETASLSLSAADADLLAAVTGTGNAVTVTALEDAPTADLSGLEDALAVTAELDSTGGVTLTAKLGPVDTLAISGDGLVTVGGAAD